MQIYVYVYGHACAHKAKRIRAFKLVCKRQIYSVGGCQSAAALPAIFLFSFSNFTNACVFYVIMCVAAALQQPGSR